MGTRGRSTMKGGENEKADDEDISDDDVIEEAMDDTWFRMWMTREEKIG